MLIRPTKACRIMYDCEPVGRIRQRRHPAKRGQNVRLLLPKTCLMALRYQAYKRARTRRPDKATPPSGKKRAGCSTVVPKNMPDGAALIRPTKGHEPVGRIRQRRHPAIKRAGCSTVVSKNMPDGAALIGPTKEHEPVGRIRQRRHPAIKRAGCSPLALKTCLMALRLSGLQKSTNP